MIEFNVKIEAIIKTDLIDMMRIIIIINNNKTYRP